jgi:hypothetical protein
VEKRKGNNLLKDLGVDGRIVDTNVDLNGMARGSVDCCVIGLDRDNWRTVVMLRASLNAGRFLTR